MFVVYIQECSDAEEGDHCRLSASLWGLVGGSISHRDCSAGGECQTSVGQT